TRTVVESRLLSYRRSSRTCGPGGSESLGSWRVVLGLGSGVAAATCLRARCSGGPPCSGDRRSRATFDRSCPHRLETADEVVEGLDFDLVGVRDQHEVEDAAVLLQNVDDVAFGYPVEACGNLGPQRLATRDVDALL